ncbi:CpXC domain-containing protein [Flavobacterium cerinum]|uniref:CpXC domain-containing protein n=1 Tax=Flavobacterium cerinum TaxID=2502784 RepID=A0ABY5IRP0_9FLAO|nr:CpXC domain-containing protein [Flavobacterium cerinum]UUC45444.1 CpXC domain-containing protein [Flavobacterium cerinum]
MSLNHKTRQNCPHCDSEQELNYYQSVNVTLNPELKREVLLGKLNRSTCTNCQKEINIISGFLYHDMTQKIMLELALADDETVDQKEQESKNRMMDELIEKGYIYRKVKEYSRLVEKIYIFDNQLNDLVIEQAAVRMKAILDESSKEVAGIEPNLDFKVYFKKTENNEITFFCYIHPSEMMEMKYDIKNLTLEEKNNLYNPDILRK